jgi:hypothetical protein
MGTTSVLDFSFALDDKMVIKMASTRDLQFNARSKPCMRMVFLTVLLLRWKCGKIGPAAGLNWQQSALYL